MNRLCLCFVLALWTVAGAQPQFSYLAGRTHNEHQHNGSCGRMIGVDGDGFVHMVWMNATSSDPVNGPRRVAYQLWDPTSQTMQFLTAGQPTGVQVDAALRAGYATLELKPDGNCFPVFHAAYADAAGYQTRAAIDFLPRMGAFTTSWPTYYREHGQPVQIGWPMTAMGADCTLHVVSEEMGDWSRPNRLFYSKGRPTWDDQGFGMGIQWQDIDTVQFALFDSAWVVGHDIACSSHGSRVARAWIRPSAAVWSDSERYNGDVYYQLSEVGGETWGQRVNLTHFIQSDRDCYGGTHNSLCCDKDTLRAFWDLSVMFDENDHLHIAFTTVGYYHWLNGMSGPFVKPNKAMIWHWGEEGDTISLLAESWIEDSLLSPHQMLKTNRAMVERPSLSHDPVSGHLYCSYLKYDTSAYSTAGYLNADVIVSVSVDGGLSWSQGTNVTISPPDTVPAPAGRNNNEQDETTATSVSNGALHVFYLLDKDAGAEPISNNPMMYEQVQTSFVTTTPLIPQRALHIIEVVCDTIHLGSRAPGLAHEFRLYPAYPNPFNGTTVLRYELPRNSFVNLSAYDVLGRETAVLQQGMKSAGEHTITWDARDVASGVYFVSLRAGSMVRTQKIMLLK